MARTIEEIIAERKAKSKTAFNDSKSRISEEEKKRDLVNLGRDQQDLALRTEQMNSFAVDDVSDYHRRDALQNEISRLEKQNTSQEKKLTTRSIVDRVVDEDVRGTGFVDTAKSNLGLGQLQQDNSLAWNRYINDPSLDNKRAAESLDAAMEYYQMKQKESLYTEDAEGKQQQRGNWISKDLAQYVPQLLDQIQAQVPAQLGAMAIGAATGGAGYAQAAQLLGGLAAGKQSFDVMRGASYKGLKELGVSEETALRISRNEALISAMIESAETIFSFSSLGFSDLLKSIGSFGVKKVAQGLAREGMEQAAESSLKKLLSVLKGYGINILTEAGEEAAQEGVAILAEKTAMRNDGLERTATAQEDWQRIAESAAGGAKIAAMMGAPAVAATQIGNRVVQRRSAERIAQNERAIKTAVSADEAKSVGIQAKKQAIVEASTGEIADVFRALGDEGSKAYRDAVISNPKDEEGIRSRMAVAYSTGLSSNKSFDDAKSLLGDGNENELRAFYEAAQKDRVTIEDSTVKTWSEAQSKIRSQRAEFLKTAEAGLLQDTYAEKLNPSVRKSLDLIAKQLGNRIVIAPRVGSDLEGRAVVDLDIVEGFADQNGFYDPNTKTIFLNADLDKKTFKTTVHEVTHAIQKQNSKGYQEFKDIVVKAIIDTQGENAFQRYSDWAMSNYNVELSVEQAQDEMVANEIARAFDDPKKFIEKYNGSVTIGRKIVEAIRKTLRKIKNTIATWNGTDAEKAEFIRYQEAMEQAQTKWMEALKGASVQKEPVQSEVATDAGDVSVLDDEPRFSFRGITEDGIEVYETSEEIKELPYRERMRIFLNLMKNEYRGRTAKFTVRNQVYYAKFDTDDIKKNIFGDKKSSRGGRIAKINTGADGSIFELVENAQYDRSGYDKGKDIKAHVGVAGWDYFLKQVQIDDVLFDLLANVRKKPDGEFVYSIQLNEHKKTAAPSRQYRKGKAEAIKNRSVRLATTVSTNSINENNSEVNQQFSLRKDDDYYNQVNSKEEIIRLIGTKYYDRINHPAFKLAKGAISDLVDTQMTLSESIEMDKDTDKPFRKQGTTNFTGQGKLIGKRFIDELVDTGRVNLTGITFQDTRELAMIAQIYRDPRFETFRIIYVRGNQIVGQKTISSRLPSVSRVTFVDDWAEVARDMKNMKDRLKADGYYILHNHPSGDPEPSNEDLSVTVSYAERAPGFINHIIINSGKYTEIGVDTTKKHRWHSMKDLPVGNDKLLKGLHVKEFIREGISRKDFLNPQKIATAAKLTQLNKDQSVAFYIGAKGELSALMEIEDSFLLGALDEVKIVSVSNFFKNRMREYGAVYAVVVVQNKKESRLFKRAMAKLIMDGSLIDGITIKENEPYFSYAEQNGTSGISWQMPLSDNVYKERTPKPKPNTQFSLRAADKKQLDEEYLEAVQANDLEKAQKMVAEYAHKQGYIQDESYKMWHKAPTNDGFNKSIDDLTDLYPDDLYSSNGARYYGMGEPRDYEAINKLRKVKGKPDAKVWVYRAVPKDVKESEIRNGDWITLTRDYAMEHGKSNIDGPFRVIKQVVLAKHVFTDANSIQEYGYDDGKNYAYQNTKNNRKLFDAVVHDDEGNVIPLSKRFDKKNYDARYSLRGSEVEITDETVGYGSGQYEMIMTAVVDGIKAGFIEYSVYQGKPYIKFINTVESMRRMGVATRLLQELQKEYPNTEIDWGYTTPDGTALKDKVTFTKKNGAYIRAKNEYLKNIERLNELERMFDEEDYSSGDEWNKVYDRQAVLEKKLRELKPSTSWVKYSLRDSEGRELTEAQAEFFKDSKVRDEDGDLLIMYHGTADKAFTIFDIDKANKSSLYGQGFYFTADKHIANEYTNKGTYAYGVVDVKPKGETEWSKDKFEYFVDVLKKHVAYYDSKYNLVHSTKGMSDEQRSAEHEKILKFMKKERKEYSDYSYFRSFLEYDITEYDVGERGLYQENPDFYLTFPGDNGKTIVVAKNALKRLFETDSVSEKIAKYGFEVEIQRPLPGSFKTYLNIKNPLYVDTQVLTDEEIEVLDLVSEANDVQYLYEKNQRWYREQYKKFHPRSLRTLLLKLEYDARDNKSKKIFGFRENLYEKVKSLGYDGMTHTGGWNVGSVEHEVWIAFSSNQIKSVDNLNPTENVDIRFSLRDSEGRELTAEQAEFFKDASIELRDENGNIKPFYHGTNTPTFTIFDPSYSDDKISLFFTDKPKVADSYTINQNNGDIVDPNRLPNAIKTVEEYNSYMEERNKPYRIFEVTDKLIDKVAKDIRAEMKKRNDNQQYIPEDLLADLERNKGKYIEYTGGFRYLTRWGSVYKTESDAIRSATEGKHLLPIKFGNKYKVYLNIKNPYVVDGGTKHSGTGSVRIDTSSYDEKGFSTITLTIGNEDFVVEVAFSDSLVDTLRGIVDSKSFSEFEKAYNQRKEENIEKLTSRFKLSKEQVLKGKSMPDSIVSGWKYEIDNVNINYIEPGRWSSLQYEGGRGKTRDIARWAKSNGHDGVIIKNVRDIGGYSGGTVNAPATIAIAFSPEQIKSVDNKHPTNDADIRFMLRNSDELVKENRLLKKENDLLKKRYELYRKQIKLSRIKPDMEKVEVFGKKFLKLQSSDMDITDFSKAAYDIFESIYFANKGKGDPAAREYAEILANELAKEVMSFYNEKMSFENEEVKEIRTMLRNIRIIPTDIAKEDLDPIKRKYRRIKWAKPEESSKPNVFDLFTAYEMFAERFPDIFDAAEDQPQEMLNRLITASEAVQTMTGSSGEDFTDYIPDVAMQMLEAYDDVVELEAVLNERQKRIQQIQAERNKAQEALKLAMEEADRQKIRYAKEQVREREIELKQALKEERKQVLAEAKKQGQAEADEELKVKIQQIEDRAKQIIEKEKLKAEARILREKKRQQERVLEERQKRKNSNNIAIQNFLKSVERTSVRKTIHQRIDKLNKMAFDPTDKAHMPSDMEQAVVDFIRIIRPMAKGTKPTENDLKRLVEIAAYIQGLDNEDNGETHLIDVDLADNLIELSKILKTKTFAFDPKGQKKENSMNLFELQVLNDALAGMSQYVKMRNQLFTDVKNSDIYKTSQAISDELSYETVMENGKLIKKPIDGYSRFESGLLQAPRDMVSTDMLAPLDFAERLGPTFQEVFQKGIRDGMDRKIKLLKRAEEYMLDLVGDAKVEEWSGPKAKLIEQYGIRMTPAQWMSLYVTVRQEQAVQHILYGGIVPTDYVVKGSGPVSLGKVQRGYEAVTLTMKQIEEIVNGELLTEDQKRIALGISDFFMSDVAEWGNEVSMKMYDYRKFTEENYFPIVSAKDYLSEEIGKVNDRTLRNMGSTKKRVRGAKNPIYLEDIFDVYSNHVDKYSSYNAFVPALSDLQRIYNQAVVQGTVKLAIAKRYGDRMQQYYKKLIVDINGGMRTEPESQFATWLTSKYKSAVIGMNLRVIVQQPTSLVRASAMIDPSYLAKGMVGKVDWELVKKYAPIAQWKDWGYFTLDVGRQLKNVFLGKENITDKMMSGVGAADRFAWLRLWRAVEIETIDLHPELLQGSEEFFQHVGKRFSEIVDRTQVVDTVLHRTGIMRGGTFSKMVTSFMSEPLKSYNLLNTAIRNYKSERTAENNAKLKRTFAAWAATVAVTGIARALMDMWRDEDESEEGFFQNFFEKWFDTVKYEPLEMFPYLRDWLSIMQGYSVERLDTQLIEKAWRAFSRLDDGKYTLAARLYNMSSVIFEAAGIPVSSATREISDLMRNTLNFFDGYEAQYSVMNMQYDVRNQANATRYIDLLFEAHREGDLDAYNNIMKSLIENGYTASKIDDGMRSRYKKAGNAPPEFQGKASLPSAEPEVPKITVESLKPAEAIKYLDNYSSVTNELMDRIKKTDIYRTGNDVLRAKIENAVLDYAKSESLSIASNGRYIEDSSWINNAKQAIEDGIGLPQYIALLEGRKEYGASIGASGVTQEETEDYLDAQRLKREEKAALWAIFYPKSFNPFK